jgi:hypothetical protein
MRPKHRPHVYVLTWEVPQELHRQMKVCAAAESLTLVEWCRRAFAAAVAARQPKGAEVVQA